MLNKIEKTKELKKVKEVASILYKEKKEIHNPYFREKIVLNSKGFRHLQFKNENRVRSPEEQIKRFRLLRHVFFIIRNSKTLQEYFSENLFILVENNQKKEKILKKVSFWGFIAIIEKRKMKVIVRQVGNGKKHFWSVIPNWKTRKSKEGRITYLNYTGSMMED
jgi:hypothetical protein